MLLQIVGGRVYRTAHDSPVDELWVHDATVVSAEEARELIAAGVSVEQLRLSRDQTVVPAFRDGHCHPLFAARESLGAHLTGLDTVVAIQQALRVYLEANPGLSWLDAAVYDRSLIAGREHDAATLLNSVSADVPIVLHADDHHTLWVNSAALVSAGLSDASAVAVAQGRIAHGGIDVDSSGAASGILREWEAMSLVLDQAPKPTMDDDLRALDSAQTTLASNGVVAVQEAWIDRGMAEVYLESLHQRRLHMRTDLAFRFAPGQWREDLAYFAEMRAKVSAAGSPLLTANTAKFFADGVLGSSTALVHEAYLRDAGLRDSSAHEAHGEAVWQREELFEATSAAVQAGFALHIHAIGDAGVSLALDAIEQAGAPANCVIAHTELVREGDFARFAKLGVVANFEPFWAQRNAMLLSCAPQLGEARLDRMYQMRTAKQQGVSISFGSDWPVSSFVPLEGIQVATTRAPIGSQEPSWVPEQALSAREAFEAYSAGTAAQMSDIDALSLKTGQRADLVVLNRDPFECPLNELAAIEVMATYSFGALVYSRD
ncbi:MAG: amidohydrolase family protein [Actinomycetales bacterium]|nr:amidohydrolase family protein [Actinomycetales bacterium]